MASGRMGELAVAALVRWDGGVMAQVGSQDAVTPQTVLLFVS